MRKIVEIGGRLSMISGQGEQARRVYRTAVGKSNRRWFWAIQDNPADNIYVDPNDSRSQGFGGAALSFAIEDGTKYDVKGPWHSNADSLFEDTGIDLRDQYLTWGVVAHYRVCGPAWQEKYVDVLHEDEDWQNGPYERIELIAKEWANKLQHPIARYSRGQGGSSSGYEIPDGWDWCDPRIAEYCNASPKWDDCV